MKRDIKEKIVNWLNNKHNALLLDGARQVGKTYIIRECLRESGLNVIEINFIESPEFIELFDTAENANDVLIRMSVRFGQQMIPGKTIIFLDEVQECKEIVTKIKFLVEDGRYRYILSGSLLGVELNDLRSAPVGYLDVLDMYPMTLFEFYKALGISDRIFDLITDSYTKRIKIDDYIHKQLLSAFYLYLIVGGMPDAVNTYLKTENIESVQEVQQNILRLYHQDFAKYEKDNKEKLKLREVYDTIPSELSEKNKRFKLNKLGTGMNYDRVENTFLWLKDAGVALPVYNVTEPVIPLEINTKRNLFKLFLSDVGLLTAQYSTEARMKILSQNEGINNGGLFEDVAAQELFAHGYKVWYYNSKKQGEVDLMIEQGEDVLPIEIKSGKDYKRHSALSNILSDPNYNIPEAFVFSNANVSRNRKVTYLPMYMLACIQKKKMDQPVFRLNLDHLKD